MRAVLDTNVLVSGLLWHGPPHGLVEQVRTGSLTLVSSPSLMARSNIDTGRMLAEVRMLADIIDPAPLPARVSRDPDDDAILALAVAAQADFIVSGDGDLLVLGRYGGIPIFTASQAVAILAS